jgi:hypothetical protein
MLSEIECQYVIRANGSRFRIHHRCPNQCHVTTEISPSARVSVADVTELIEELCVDGGKVRLRTAQGLECIYKDYKAIHTNSGLIAGYQDNIGLINWVNSQPIAKIVTCLGDGHDGIWNIIALVAPNRQRREILDWYHLIENLNKVGGSQRRINEAQAYLWMGQVEKAKQLFANLTKKAAHNFCVYLNKHRTHR